MMSRRSILAGLLSSVAAPAIARLSFPVAAPPEPSIVPANWRLGIRFANIDVCAGSPIGPLNAGNIMSWDDAMEWDSSDANGSWFVHYSDGDSAKSWRAMIDEALTPPSRSAPSPKPSNPPANTTPAD